MMEFDDMSVETTFSPCLWLDYLTDVAAFEEMRRLAISSGEKEKETGFLRGYEFALVATMYEFIDSAIRSPSTLDIPYDEGLKDAWSSSRNRGRESLVKLVRKNSPVSYLFHSINTHWNRLLSIDSWDGLAPERIALSEWSRVALRGFRYAYTCATAQRRLHEDPYKLLHAHAIDWLWPHTVHIGLISGIYSDVYAKKPEVIEGTHFPEDWADDRPSTRLNEPDRGIFFSKRPPDSWAAGFAASISFLLQKLDLKHSSDIQTLAGGLTTVSTWRELDQQGRRAPLNFKASRKTHFKKVRSFPKSSLRNMSLPVKRGFRTDQLLGIMGCPLRIIETDGLSAPWNFQRVLLGTVAIAKRNKEKVRVIDLVHKKANYPTGHSLALLMPMHTLISNWSTWWVFFDMYDDYMLGEDTENAVFRKIVNDTLSQQAVHIDMEKYVIGKEDLLSIAEEPGFAYLRDELAQAKNVNWNVRGALPELVGATYFGSMNYHPIRVDMKPGFLQGKELDVVGVEWERDSPASFQVLEFKGYSVSSDRELQEQIDKFAEKISTVRRHRKQMADEIGVRLTPPRVRGIFISMADIYRLNLKTRSKIDVWSYADFVREIKDKKIPLWHLQLLRKSSVALTIAFGESMQNLLFGDGQPRGKAKRTARSNRR